MLPLPVLISLVLSSLPPSPAASPLPPRPAAPAPDPAAAAVLDTAIARMGGAARLGEVQRVRFEMLTEWQRTSFEDHPYADAPSHELHTELRDYALGGWRNTRRFPAPGGAWREVVDLVADGVAIRLAAGQTSWTPLNVAYVDERRELFAAAPERALLAARAAGDLRALADTAIAGSPHARVAATVDGRATELFLRRGDGLPAMLRYRAAHPNDLGLTAWGEMEVEVWYSRWQPVARGLAYPLQWDVRRVGRPYKRMTVLGAAFDLPATPDSFAVSEPLRAAFHATANRPMHDVPLDSARLLDGGRLATFRAMGAPAGAVKLGGRWLLLEAGVAPLSAERAADWLERADPGAAIAGAVVTMPFAGNGGVRWLAARGVPLHVAPGARPFVDVMLRAAGADAPGDAARTVEAGQWLHVGGDSAWIEPLDLPNGRGTAMVYVPSLRWLYLALGTSPLDLRFALARARERGFTVERHGNVGAIVQGVGR